MVVINNKPYFTQRFQAKSNDLLCQLSARYKAAKPAKEVEKKMAELGFILTFLPYFSNEFAKELDCYYNGRITT